jgi:hypothetical protein
MRKMVWIWGVLVIFGLSLLLVSPPGISAQWGAIRRGVDAARRAAEPRDRPPTQERSSSSALFKGSDATGGKVSTAPVTYRNKIRPFSYTIPAGWEKVEGTPTGKKGGFMKPGTTCGFTFMMNQMVPSFPRAAAVKAGYKQAREEMTIRKYQAVKRRNQGSVIGWETIETAEKGSGGFQRIQWQCYDKDNYYYSFVGYSEPKDFNSHRAVLQRIVDSVRFSR